MTSIDDNFSVPNFQIINKLFLQLHSIQKKFYRIHTISYPMRAYNCLARRWASTMSISKNSLILTNDLLMIRKLAQPRVKIRNDS